MARQQAQCVNLANGQRGGVCAGGTEAGGRGSLRRAGEGQ